MRYGASRRLFGAPFCSPWSSRVRAVVAHDDDARAVTAGGQNGHVGNKHFIDQAERYATGNLRPVYFYRNSSRGTSSESTDPAVASLLWQEATGRSFRRPEVTRQAIERRPGEAPRPVVHHVHPDVERRIGLHLEARVAAIAGAPGRRGRVGRWRAPMARCGTSCTRSSSTCNGSASRSPPGSSSSPRDSAPHRRTLDAP